MTSRARRVFAFVCAVDRVVRFLRGLPVFLQQLQALRALTIHCVSEFVCYSCSPAVSVVSLCERQSDRTESGIPHLPAARGCKRRVLFGCWAWCMLPASMYALCVGVGVRVACVRDLVCVCVCVCVC
jgi:hypothetical protein